MLGCIHSHPGPHVARGLDTPGSGCVPWENSLPFLCPVSSCVERDNYRLEPHVVVRIRSASTYKVLTVVVPGWHFVLNSNPVIAVTVIIINYLYL